MKKGFLKSLLIAVFCGFYAFGATAAVSLFSDYGQIQNVQNYSTNPFWTPNSPYNQRLPQPVYVQGADLTADDCFKVVQSLVSVQCMARDNCKNTTLADIRPTIMVQLSNLPGNNYVSACSGFIDGVFESYVAQYGNNIPNRAAAFPNATTPNPDINKDNDIKIQNPYKRTIPQWQQEIIERSNELEQLRQESGAGSEHLSATDFSATYADLSFTDRVKLATTDYAQYKDKNAYTVPNIQNLKDWCAGKGAGSPECKTEEEQHQDTTTAQNNNQNNNQGTGGTTLDGGNGSVPPPPVDTEETKYAVRIRLRGPLLHSYDGRTTNSGKQCFAVCGESVADDLNMQVLKKTLNGKYYCARKKDGVLVENNDQSKILEISQQQKENIKQQIASTIADKGHCDWRADNVVMQFGKFAPDENFAIIDEVLLDD